MYKSPLAFYNLPRIVSRRIGRSKAAMKNMSTLYQHLPVQSWPRVKTMAAAWQVWDSVQGGVGDTIHIDYDGEYGSERGTVCVSPRLRALFDCIATGFAVNM